MIKGEKRMRDYYETQKSCAFWPVASHILQLAKLVLWRSDQFSEQLFCRRLQ